MTRVGEQIGDMLGSVSGGMTRSHQDRTEPELIAIFDSFVVEPVARAPFMADVDFCGIDSAAQFTRPTYQVGMDMCLKNMRDGDVLCPSHFDVNVHIGPGIEHRCHAFLIITN